MIVPALAIATPSDKPSAANNVTDDLHALLRAAGITDRMVLVGHSLGGLFATLYADKFQSNVAGLVLVDPSFFGQFDYLVSWQDEDVMRPGVNQWVSLMQTCKKLAQDGRLSKSDRHDCFQPPLDLTSNEAGYVTQQFFRPSYYASILSEFESFSPKIGPGTSKDGVDGTQEQQLKRSLGNLPLEILTAAVTFHDPRVSEAGNKAMEDVWRLGHDKLAQRSTRGESIVIRKSHHFVQLDQSQPVVEAIGITPIEPSEQRGDQLFCLGLNWR